MSRLSGLMSLNSLLHPYVQPWRPLLVSALLLTKVCLSAALLVLLVSRQSCFIFAPMQGSDI